MTWSIEFAFFHYAIWPLVLGTLCRAWFGPFGRLPFAWVFLVTWLLLIHAQALVVFEERFPHTSFLFSVWSTPLIILVVAGSITRGLGHRPPPLKEIVLGRPRSERDRVVHRIAPLLTVGLWSLIIVYIWDIGTRNIAFFFLLANPGSAVDAMSLRLAGMTSNISPVLGMIYGYARAFFLPLYTAVATAHVVSGRMSVMHWVTILLGAGVFSLLTAAKAPLAFTLAAVGLAAYLVRPSQIGLRKLGLAFCLTLFLPALIYPLISGDTGKAALEVAGKNLWRRVTYVTAETGAVYFDAFPSLHDFQGPRSNRLLAKLANVPVEATPVWVYDRYLDTGVLHGGTVNTAFYASFFADWGGVGVVGGAIVVGLVIFALQVFFDRRSSRDATSIGVRAATLVALTQLMASDFYGVALGRGLLSIPLLLWGFDIVIATLNRNRGAYYPNRRRAISDEAV
ncbi:MAG: hypothetical protein WD771_06705 [Gemmatimonadaceae bacterium]